MTATVTFELLKDTTATAVLSAYPLNASGATPIGRESLGIADRRLSRKQLIVSALPGGNFTVQRTGPNPSFYQAGSSEKIELAKEAIVPLPAGALIFLAQHPDTREFQYPSRVIIHNGGGSAAPAEARPSPPTANVPPGVWQVKLGGAFKPYDPPVQAALEAAFMSGAWTCDVTIRGSEYTIYLHHPARQHAKADPTRTRPVRRECGPPVPSPSQQPAPGQAHAATSVAAPVAGLSGAAQEVASSVAPAAAPHSSSSSSPTSLALSSSSSPHGAKDGVGAQVGDSGDGNATKKRKLSLMEQLAEEEERIRRKYHGGGGGGGVVGSGGCNDEGGGTALSRVTDSAHARSRPAEAMAASTAAPKEATHDPLGVPHPSDAVALPTKSEAVEHTDSISKPHSRGWLSASNTLAFPSLSTGAFQFDVHRAAATCMREVSAFLRAHPASDITLVLVESASDVRVAMRDALAAEPGLSADGRFLVADETASLHTLRTGGVVQPGSTAATIRPNQTPGARFVCNAANHKLSSRGGGVNRALHAATGKVVDAAGGATGGATGAAGAGGCVLEELTRVTHPPSGKPGHAYAVELPAGNPLREAQGVEWVLHAVGPNMNPDRPLCLYGDYGRGAEQLAETYKAVFEQFHELAIGRGEGDAEGADV